MSRSVFFKFLGASHVKVAIVTRDSATNHAPMSSPAERVFGIYPSITNWGG
ncbi:hypothetical protein AN958_04669 [Leucoagaricus sp. SymC.cos]|nr:hypothetical protein AN958_04669 [Leucoagaricus sp. SymC.cos]